MTITSDITSLGETVMRGVVASGVVNADDPEAVGRAVEIIRSEVWALLAGPEYEDDRAAVLAHTVSEMTVVQSAIASCILKITRRGKRAAERQGMP
ncbi:MAG: hypothetical protein ACRDI2_05310 [Chloroflexota bacterium]